MNIIKMTNREDAIKLAKGMLESRSLNKLIGTYYSEELIYPDDYLHPSYNHTETVTGRLSCKGPNLQNQPRDGTSKVKQHFVSRFGDEGQWVTTDFSQLEVVSFAFLTQDPQLIEDVSTSDVHSAIGTQVFGKPVSKTENKELRQLIKPIVFLIIYGGGAWKAAKDLNMEIDFVQSVIDAFYARYPKAKEWQDNLVKQVEENSYLDPTLLSKEGNPVYKSKYKNVTGRILTFRTWDAPEFLKKKGQIIGFNPPDIKNWPNQSLATSDVVLIFLGKLWRKLLPHRERCLLINTVHDSIDADVKKEFVETYCKIIQDEVQLIPQWLKEEFNLDWNIPIEVEIKRGSSWFDC
jgi:DNA polymerase-1